MSVAAWLAIVVIVGLTGFLLGMVFNSTMLVIIAKRRREERLALMRDLEKPRLYGSTLHIGSRTLR